MKRSGFTMAVILALAMVAGLANATSYFYVRILHEDSTPGQAGNIIQAWRREASATWTVEDPVYYSGSGYVQFPVEDNVQCTFLGDAYMNATVRYSDWSTPTFGGGTTHYIDLVIKYDTAPPMPD
jgi:hypothetical protein